MTVYGRRVWIAVVGAAIAVGGMPSLVFAEAEKASVAIAAQPTYSQSVSTGGDSGGAVSSSNTGQWARGVHQGSDGSTKYFTNIAYLSTYGLGSVATG